MKTYSFWGTYEATDEESREIEERIRALLPGFSPFTVEEEDA